MYSNKQSWRPLVEGDQKVPFSIATTKGEGRALLLSLDCSTLPLICTLYRWVLRKAESSTIFKVFGMTRPGIEPRASGPLANTLLTRPMSRLPVQKSVETYWMHHVSNTGMFHHFNVQMKVQKNQNVLTSTFFLNEFITLFFKFSPYQRGLNLYPNEVIFFSSKCRLFNRF